MPIEKNFYRGTLTNSTAELYAVTPGKRASVQSIDICNREASDNIYVTIYLVPKDGSAGNDNLLFEKLPIQPGASYAKRLYSWRGFHPIDDEGGTIEGKAEDDLGAAVSVTINISGTVRNDNPEKVTV